MKQISVGDFLKALSNIPAKVIYGEEFLDNIIDSPRVQRPGLALAGFFYHIRPGRVQLFGETEFKYMETVDAKSCRDFLFKLAEINNCVFFITNGQTPTPGMLEAAKEYKLPVVSMSAPTVDVSKAMELYLDDVLAPETVVHGVCMEVYGIGVVITGKSGIGKSECAIELIKRGHKLVSDDAVIVKRCLNELIGTSDDLLNNYIELRGIGVLNITNMFGLTAVNPRKKIEMFIDFVDYDEWNDEYSGDRIGLDNRTKELLGIELPNILCPVSPGRNMSEIVELAVKNQLMKQMGYDSAVEFTKAVAAKIQEKQG